MRINPSKTFSIAGIAGSSLYIGALGYALIDSDRTDLLIILIHLLAFASYVVLCIKALKGMKYGWILNAVPMAYALYVLASPFAGIAYEYPKYLVHNKVNFALQLFLASFSPLRIVGYIGGVLIAISSFGFFIQYIDEKRKRKK